MRCATHGLATGPDGLCVLCRKAEAKAASSSNVLGFVAAAAVLLSAVVGFALVSKRRPVVTVQTVSNAVIEPNREAPEAVVTAEVLPPAPAPVATERQPLPSSTPSPSPSAEPAPEVAKPALAATAPTLPPPSDADVQAALHATPIVMYGASWCKACAMARAFLDANRLRRVEHDIDADEGARADLKRLAGKLSVPVLIVDGVMLAPGFSEEAIQRALVASVEKRLGVRGVEARPRL